jgi:hypothetical protein
MTSTSGSRVIHRWLATIQKAVPEMIDGKWGKTGARRSADGQRQNLRARKGANDSRVDVGRVAVADRRRA